MDTVTEAERRLPVSARADVLVVGAGVSGLAAAVSAARAGARTMLIERTGLLGGVATSGLMASTTNHMFDGAGRQVVRGFAEEFLDRMAAAGGVSANYKAPHVPQFPHDPEVFQVVADRMLGEAGVEVMLHCWFSQPVMQGNKVAGAVVEAMSGRAAITSSVNVDCTGNADVAARAGTPTRTVEKSGVSLEFRMGNVNLDATYLFFKEHPEEYPPLTDIATTFEQFERNWVERGIFHIPHGGGAKMRWVQQQIAAGAFSSQSGSARGLDHFGMYALRGTDTAIINANFFDIDPLDALAVSKAQREARVRCFEVAEFLRNNLPGFERGFILTTAPEIGVRMSRCIEGEYVMTAADRDGGARFDDVVGMGSEVIRSVRPPAPFDIPYRILVPRGVDGLLTGGAKNVSTERPGLIRGQVHGMVLGQAAGVAAALCAQQNLAPRSLDILPLQRSLLQQNAYLGDPDRLRSLGLRS